MRLIQQLNTVPLYLTYFLNVVDEHSIQAPFAFQFYTKIRKLVKRGGPVMEIEKARTKFLHDNSLVVGQDLGAGSRIKKSKTVSSVARYGISSKEECIFLHELAAMCKAKICVELGTSLGIATAYLAAVDAIKSIYTFEGDETLVATSNQLFQDLGIEKVQIIHGNIDDELPNILEQVSRIDLAIIDANHTGKALLRYADLLKGKMSENGVLFIDDIRWSTEMYRAWKKLVGFHEFTISMEFMNNGLLFLKKGMTKQHYVLAL